MAILAWLQCVVGVLLPVLVAASTAPPPEPPPPQPDPAPQQQRQQAEGQQPEVEQARGALSRRGRAKAAAGGWLRRGAGAAGAVSGGLARLDGALTDCCRKGGLPLLQLLAGCCVLTANFWLLAQAAASRSLPG